MEHIYTESQFTDEIKREYNLSLEKTDRNGTKYYGGVQKCWKCNGHRYFYCWGHVSNGVCFACNGSGVNPCTVKVMTDEHYQKLEDKRLAKIQKKHDEKVANSEKLNKEFALSHGFNEEGFAWVVFGTDGNTYNLRFELKEKGAKFFSNGNAWYFTEPKEEYNYIKVSIEDCYEKDDCGCFINLMKGGMADVIFAKKEEIRLASAKNVEYFGNVGDKVADVEVTFTKFVQFETMYGIMEIYTFEDDEHHVFVWKTSSGMNIQKGDKVHIKFTIKDHEEYRDVKQTVITRCKKVA